MKKELSVTPDELDAQKEMKEEMESMKDAQLEAIADDHQDEMSDNLYDEPGSSGLPARVGRWKKLKKV